MSNQLATIPLQDVQHMADAMAASGLFGVKNAVQAMALMLVAQAEGQHPASIAQDYDIIQGRAARKTHSVLSRFQAAGGKVQWHTLTDAEAEATFSHPSGGSLRIGWTLEQAKKAGLTGKDNWKNYPRAMLRARCIAEGVRAVYPAAIGGLMVSEEAADAPIEKFMGPAEVVGAPPSPPPPPAPPPTWPDEAFATQLPRWTKAVAAGLKTNIDILAMARSKGALTPEQEAAIAAIPPKADEVEDAEVVQ